METPFDAHTGARMFSFRASNLVNDRINEVTNWKFAITRSMFPNTTRASRGRYAI
jgi:hypothetical protein